VLTGAPRRILYINLISEIDPVTGTSVVNILVVDALSDSAFSTAITNAESPRQRRAPCQQPTRWPRSRTEEYSGGARSPERRRGGDKGGKRAGEATKRHDGPIGSCSSNRPWVFFAIDW
jgi:hypothetical protein